MKTVLFWRGSKPTGISLFHVSSSQILLYFTGGREREGGRVERERGGDEKERNCYSLSLFLSPFSPSLALPLSGDKRSCGVRVL